MPRRSRSRHSGASLCHFDHSRRVAERLMVARWMDASASVRLCRSARMLVITRFATSQTAAGWKPAKPTRDRAGVKALRFPVPRSIASWLTCLSRAVSAKAAWRLSQRTRKLPGTNSRRAASSERPRPRSSMATPTKKVSPSSSPLSSTCDAAIVAATAADTALIDRQVHLAYCPSSSARYFLLPTGANRPMSADGIRASRVLGSISSSRNPPSRHTTIALPPPARKCTVVS